MKKLALFIFLLVVMFGCTIENTTDNTNNIPFNLNGWECKVIVIDSCEYIQGGYMLSHKGNCKYCAGRRKKEQEELIRKIKEQ